MAPEAQLIAAARSVVAALTAHHDVPKRMAKLRKIEAHAEAMRSAARDASNVVNIRSGRALSEPTEAERERDAVAALIMVAISAERSAAIDAYREASNA